MSLNKFWLKFGYTYSMRVTQKEILALLSRIHLFNGLDQNQISNLISKTEVLEYEVESFVFEENTNASNFYIIISGQITIEVEIEKGAKKILILREDDYFGEDVLSETKIRHTSSKATQPTIVLSIPGNELINLIEENQVLFQAFKIILANYENLLKYEASWIKPEEAIRFLSRAHHFYLISKSLTPLFVAVFAFILSVILYFQTDISVTIIFPIGGLLVLGSVVWIIWNVIDWFNDYFLITNQRVVYLEKVLLLYESRQETPLGAILSITKQTGLIGRIFGFGDIAIRTYTGVLYFRNLAYPDHVIRLLTEQWERAKKRLTREDHEEMEALLREKFTHNENEEEKETKEAAFTGQTQVKSGWILTTLASLFGMRTEVDGVINYRTHWFVLIRKIFLPTLAILVLLILFLIYGGGNFAFLPQNILFPVFGLITLGVIIWWVYRFVDWRNDLYIITQDQLVDINRKPMGFEDRRSAPIKNIQSVEYKRLGIIGLLFNFGTVFIRIGDTEFTFDYVHNPSQVQKEIFDRYTDLMNVDKDAQTDKERRRMADWMEAYHHIMMEQDGEQE
jgi:uncharacterized membrane protein YdbT with pleckstrin-like domain